MEQNENLFKDFPKVSKAQSIDKMIADLKGKSPEALQFEINKEITLAPAYFSEDITQSAHLPVKKENDWLIGEQFNISDAKLTNKQLLAALSCGINAPMLSFDNYQKGALAKVMNQVRPDFIFTAIEAKTGISFLLEDLKEWSNDYSNLKGMIVVPQSNTIESIEFAKQYLNNFKCVPIDGTSFFGGSNQIVEELTDTILSCNKILSQQPGDLTAIASKVFFKIEIGQSYFINIAKIRALQLLWGNLQKAYNIKPKLAFIDANLGTQTQVEDKYSNMIAATTQAMSATIGGADRLTVAPSDSLKGQSSDFTRRIARNLQHLLKLESYLDRVSDPSAGSYYIENLTLLLSQKAWAKFQELA